MNVKNIGIVVIIISVTIISTISVLYTQNNVDRYAIGHDAIDALLNKESVFVIDIRTSEQYQSGHITGASHDILKSATLDQRINTIKSKLPEIASTYNFVLIDNDGTEAKEITQTMNNLGMKTFYLDGGMNNLSVTLETSSTVVINSEELSQKIAQNEQIYLLDVREPEELLQSKIDGVVNIPLAKIFDKDSLNEIPKDKPVVVICGSGNRATIATYALAKENVDFQVLEGGMKAWDSFHNK